MKVRRIRHKSLSSLPRFVKDRTRILWILSFSLRWNKYGIAFMEHNLLEPPEEMMPLITREVAENAVPPTDCGGHVYTPIEWEDNVRQVLWGAEIQRYQDYYGESLIRTGGTK